MSWIMSIEPLIGDNYSTWREKIDMYLALSDLDMAITEPRPVEPTLLEIPADLSADAKVEREKENNKLMRAYEINKAMWEKSNRKCLMVIKERITNAIRGGIPDCDTAIEYLEKVKSQFMDCSKVYTSTLMKRIFTAKYTGGGIEEHILRMSNWAAKLKSMDMEIKDELLMNIILISLPKEFDTFAANYCLISEKWTFQKFMALCVQEEERLEHISGGDSVYLAEQESKGQVEFIEGNNASKKRKMY